MKRFLLAIQVISSVWMICLWSLLVIDGPRPVVKSDVSFAPRYDVGAPEPQGLPCEPQEYANYFGENCTDGDYLIVYDPVRQIVTDVIRDYSHRTLLVGDLIDTLGAPSGAMYGVWGGELVYTDGTFVVYSNPYRQAFGPKSRVMFVYKSMYPHTSGEWQGFRDE